MPLYVDDSNDTADSISKVKCSAVSTRTKALIVSAESTPIVPMTEKTMLTCLQGETAILCLRKSSTLETDSGCYFVGSIEATTCIIALCRAKSMDRNGEYVAAALASHIGAVRNISEFRKHVQRLIDLITDAGSSREQAIELSLFGAFDPSSHDSSVGLVEALIESVSNLHIKLIIASVWDINTKIDESRGDNESRGVLIPRTTAAAVDVRSGELKVGAETRNLYAGSIPFEVQRRARSTWSNSPLFLLPTFYCCTDCNASLDAALSVPVKFSVDVYKVQCLLSMTDEDLLESISTSPDAEEPSFILTQRKVMEYVVDKLMGR